jgi:hypothetical protein
MNRVVCSCLPFRAATPVGGPVTVVVGLRDGHLTALSCSPLVFAGFENLGAEWLKGSSAAALTRIRIGQRPKMLVPPGCDQSLLAGEDVDGG